MSVQRRGRVVAGAAAVYFLKCVEGSVPQTNAQDTMPDSCEFGMVMGDPDDEWAVAETEQGDVYYYHLVTGETAWEPPPWTKEADPKSGHDYFLHAASGESRWELPAGAAPKTGRWPRRAVGGGEAVVIEERVADRRLRRLGGALLALRLARPHH